MRRHWSGFTPKSHFTQHNFHYTCNVALHKPLWRIQSSFLFFLNGGTKPLHHEKDIDRFIVVLRFSEPPQFLNTLFLRELVFPSQTAKWTESLALRQVLAPPWAAPLVNWTTPFLRLRSCLVRIFHLASFRVRFSICLFHQSHTSSSL